MSMSGLPQLFFDFNTTSSTTLPLLLKESWMSSYHQKESDPIYTNTSYIAVLLGHPQKAFTLAFFRVTRDHSKYHSTTQDNLLTLKRNCTLWSRWRPITIGSAFSWNFCQAKKIDSFEWYWNCRNRGYLPTRTSNFCLRDERSERMK